MIAEDIDRDLTPSEMAQLRAEFQRMGMTLAQATEAASILARMRSEWIDFMVSPELLK